MDVTVESTAKKSHRERRAGRKAERKKEKTKHVQELTAQQRNPKAFAFHSIVKTQRKVARTEDIKSRKQHIPVVKRTPLEPPPVLVAVVGGNTVGKSTLIRSLIRNYARQKLSTIEGPITVVIGKKQRITFLEVKKDINCMIDVAKIADVVLLLIDITIGFEMEVFEFLEICRAYGTPRIMGILNHLDSMKNNKGLRKRKKELTHRFQVELYPGAKLFYLTGILHGEYLRSEITKLSRYIAVLKFRPLQFRSSHPYVLVDRMEDITNVETIRQNPVCNRNVVLYGYVRGIPMQPNQNVHIPGVGDYCIKEINMLDDPCALPDQLKKRSLNSKERLLYAPMSGVAGVIYDKDAIYIDLGGSHHGRKFNTKNNQDIDDDDDEPKEELDGKSSLLQDLMQKQKTSDEDNFRKGVRAFSFSKVITHAEEDDDDDDDEDKDSESEEENDAGPKFEAHTDEDGNIRRRVIFEDEANCESGIESDDYSEDDDNENDDDDDEDNDNNDLHAKKKLKNDNLTQEDPESKYRKSEESKSENKLTFTNLPGLDLTSNVSSKSYVMFLQNAIYGDPPQDLARNVNYGEGTTDFVDDDDNDLELFKKVNNNIGKTSSKLPGGAEFDGLDSFKRTSILTKDWANKEVLESIRDCFVTGEWSEQESAEKLLKLDDEDKDLYGDFEDLETGTKVKADDDAAAKETPVNEEVKKRSEKTAQEKRIEKKQRLKEFFNNEYDDKGSADYYDTLKAEAHEQAELNQTQFEGLDDETRILYEGYRAGLYVRMEFEGMHSELVTNFDSSYPLIVGGLLDNELAMGYVKVRMKVHRWFPRILKNRDPLYLSLGWRRFQTMMFYAHREDNFRLRSLKYAQKYVHVEALFWGPVTEMSSGFVAVQSNNTKTSEFSIAANGVVLETDQTTKLVKKLKLVGHPDKVFQKTAFVKDMFHSDTEVTKFEGVKIRTQSSIRGVVKKAIGLEGSFRATFEDIIKLSDTVFMTTWVAVEIPKFCSIVKNLLLPIGEKLQWQGMKTNYQIKKENNIKNLPNEDSLYTAITERRQYVELPLVIPKKLQAALPYKNKPKITPAAAMKQKRVFVVKDPEEVKMDQFMNRLKSMMKDKVIKDRMEKLKKHQAYKKELMKKEEFRKARDKKKKAYCCKMKSVKKTKL